MKRPTLKSLVRLDLDLKNIDKQVKLRKSGFPNCLILTCKSEFAIVIQRCVCGYCGVWDNKLLFNRSLIVSSVPL